MIFQQLVRSLRFAAIFLMLLPGCSFAQQGGVNLNLTHIKALHYNTQPYPARTQACYQRYHQFLHSYQAQYDYDTHTAIGLAYATVNGVQIELHPMGIDHQIDFISSGLPAVLRQQEISSVYLIMDDQFAYPQLNIQFTPVNSDYTCVLSNTLL